MNTLELVVPCHNEAARLDTTAFLAAPASYPGLFLRFVDDGSTDATPRLLKELATIRPDFRVETLSDNLGKSAAVRTGILAACAEARADLVGFMDADLATPLAEIDRLRAAFDDPAVRAAIGSRDPARGTRMRRSAFRRITGGIMRALIHRVLRADIRDTQCGAKLFDRTLAAEIFKQPFTTRWLFDVEVLKRIGSVRLRENLREIALTEWHDVPGSNLGLKDTFAIYRELLRLSRATTR